MAISYQTAKFKSTNILAINSDLGSTAKFNFHQYFRLYSILYLFSLSLPPSPYLSQTVSIAWTTFTLPLLTISRHWTLTPLTGMSLVASLWSTVSWAWISSARVATRRQRSSSQPLSSTTPKSDASICAERGPGMSWRLVARLFWDGSCDFPTYIIFGKNYYINY